MLEVTTYSALLLCNMYKLGQPVCKIEQGEKVPDKPKELPQDESASFNVGPLTCNGGFDRLGDVSIKIFFERSIFLQADEDQDGLLSFDEYKNSLVKFRGTPEAEADKLTLGFFASMEKKCKQDGF